MQKAHKKKTATKTKMRGKCERMIFAGKTGRKCLFFMSGGERRQFFFSTMQHSSYRKSMLAKQEKHTHTLGGVARHVFGSDIAVVCTIDKPVGGRACVVLLSCCSILTRCFRMSSSLSFTFAASTSKSVAEGRHAGGGRTRCAKAASSVSACSKRWRTQLTTTRPTRNKYGMPTRIDRRPLTTFLREHGNSPS